MTPPLGSLSPETRHLNLKFTVRDTDEIIANARRHMSAEGIAALLNQRGVSGTISDVVRICFEAGVFVRCKNPTRTAR